MNNSDRFSCTGPIQPHEHAVHNRDHIEWPTISIRGAVGGAESSLVARALTTLNRPPQRVDEVVRPPEQATLCTPPSSCTLPNLKAEAEALVTPPVVPSQGEQCAEPPVLAKTSATTGVQDASDMATRIGPEVGPPCWSDTILSFACQQTSHPTPFAAFDSCEPVLVEHVEQQPLPVSFLSAFAVSAQNHGCPPTFPSDQPYTNPTTYLPVVKLEERPLLCDPLPDWSSTLVGFDLCPPPPICPASPFGTEIAALTTTMAGTMGAWCEDWCSMLSAGDTGASSSQYKVAMAASSVMPTVSQVPVLASPCPAIVPLQQSPPFATKYEEESIEQLEPLHSATSPTIHNTSLGNLSSFGCYHATLQSASATAQSSATNSAPISFVTSAPPALPPGPNPTNRCTRSIKRTPASASASLKCHYPGCDKLFSSLHNLNEHRQVHEHPRVRTYLCGIGGCPNRYFYKRDLQRHRRKKHEASSHLQVSNSKAKTKDSAQKRFKSVRTSCSTAAPGAKRLIAM